MNKKGFTLIELLVVIAIIGLLAGTVSVGLQDTRGKARDAIRKSDLKQMKTALEVYFADNGSYPSTGGGWRGVCVNGGSRDTSGANAYIPGLTPTYYAVLPVDPLDIRTGWSGYLYRSNGAGYKLLAHNVGPENIPNPADPTADFYDPRRPTWAWMVCGGTGSCGW